MNKNLTFEDIHKPCPNCGAMIDTMETLCYRCSQDKQLVDLYKYEQNKKQD
ncbi:MAG: hypothetical protein ACOC1K_07680 [Nanoarchaeota archaeon]